MYIVYRFIIVYIRLRYQSSYHNPKNNTNTTNTQEYNTHGQNKEMNSVIPQLRKHNIYIVF